MAPTVAAQRSAETAAAIRHRAEQLRHQQRLAEALVAYRTLVDRDSAGFEDRFWVAKLEGWTGRLEVAESAFVRLLEERPDDYDSAIGLADVRMWRGQPAASRVVLEHLSRTHSGDAELLVRLGRVAEATGDPGEARRYYTEVLQDIPGHPDARAGLRRLALTTRWEADLQYYGEQLAGQGAANGGTLSLGARATDRVRWLAAATLQEKFDRTESRIGGELGFRALGQTELRGSAYLAPGAEVLSRQLYGLGVSRKLGRLVLHADYAYLDFRDASVHQLGPSLDLYAGRHWLLAARYRYSNTDFGDTTAAVGNHAGSAALGYLYGSGSLVRIFAAAGGEAFSQPSRDVIGEFHAHTFGGSWRHFLTPRVGFELVYAHQVRSDGADQDAYSVRVVQRW